jgi:hypothetical protein
VREHLGVIFRQKDLSLFGLFPITFQNLAEEKRSGDDEVFMDLESYWFGSSPTTTMTIPKPSLRITVVTCVL